MRRPVDLAPPSRAAQRKQRLLELENEQRIEDAETLKMTEEQRLSLFHSFRAVNFEWSDLDGMRSVRRRYNSPPRLQLHPYHQQPASTPVSVPPPQPQAPAFAVLTNARLAAFSADDTICVRRSASSPAPAKPKKSRSPVNGLFAFPLHPLRARCDPPSPPAARSSQSVLESILPIPIISSAMRSQFPLLPNFNSTYTAATSG
ncbi:hypothetical protein DFH09DRAFT_1402621 [Mycena vulgaris]|nr:hypothetical protein DFH09DRAFT_1402621 [Mycena vulgaris]